MNMNLAAKEQINFKENLSEMSEVLEILHKIEDHTANLRRKMMSELRPKANLAKLNLEKI